MPDQCYFDGDFYQCLGLAAPGESPLVAPSKWSRVRLLPQWRFALAHLTFAELLRLDGQTDKAAAERRLARTDDEQGLDVLTRGEAIAEEHRRMGARRGGPASARSVRGGQLKASVVLDDAYRMIGWDAASLDDRDKQDARNALSQAVQQVWQAWWWAELMQCARLQFATTLDLSATYQAGQTAYDAEEDRYLTALRDCTGSDTDSFEIYSACRRARGAFDATADYTAGEQFSYAGTDYQAYVDYAVGEGSLVVRSAGTSAANGTYARESATNYTQNGGTHTLTFIVNEGWYLYTEFAVALYFCEEANFPLGPWVTHLGDAPAPTVTGGPPTDTDFFAPLQHWQPALPWTSYGGIPQEPYGPVRGVSNFDPRVSPNAEFYELQVIQGATRVVGLANTHPWVWARRVTPIITGDEWDAETEYTATPQTAVVYGTDDDSFYMVEGAYLQIQV